MDPCRKSTRRDVLRLGALGLTLPQWFALSQAAPARPASADRCFGRAKSCILVFAWGGLSHIDTFDLKLEAGSDIKSAFRSIPTTLPGYRVCEHLPQLARQVHRMTLIRSMHHDAPSHRSAAYWNLTGHAPVHPDKNWPRSRKDWPAIGSMVSYANRDLASQLPGAVALPYPIFDGGMANGQHAGFLGLQHDPVIVKPPGGTPYEGKSPVMGHISLEPIEGVDHQRLVSRRSLLENLGRPMGTAADGAASMHYRDRAIDMLLDPKTRRAFDLRHEPARQHERYGTHICGQSMLMARNLAQAGVPLVTVYAAAGDLNGSKGAHFDTHGNGYARLRDHMLPPLDQALSGLLDDLHESQAIDETLVVLLTEFGRTPKVKGDGGRDHYPHCYTVGLAGAGVSEGLLYGASDKQGAFPAGKPTSPADLHATIFHALGIPPDLLLRDHLGRPFPMCDGRVVPVFG
jgi:hypothetical protein